jgi:hypothetical protein
MMFYQTQARFFSLEAAQVQEKTFPTETPNLQDTPYLVIADSTLERVRDLRLKDSSRLFLKIVVEAGGCSGF